MKSPRKQSALASGLAAALILIAGCGSETSSTETVTTTATGAGQPSSSTETSTTTATEPSTSSTSSGEEGAPPAADVEVTKLTGFTSPTGNIGCIIDRRTVRCDIAERDWQPPTRPAGCSEQVDFGQGISLDAGGSPAFVCAGDTALGAGDPLPYGQSIAAGLLRCESEESGMSCRDTETGRGFTISKQSYGLR